MRYLPFRREVIARETPDSENDVCLLADLTGNGWLDILIGGKFGVDSLCWHEAPHWTRHTIGQAYLEPGDVLLGVNGNGRLDVVGKPYLPGRWVDVWWNTW